MIKPYIHETPILTCESLNKLAGCNLFFKCENFQKTGSFKARGATYKTSKLVKEGKVNGICTHSYGNHGGAVAFCGEKFNIPAIIVMPTDSPMIKKKNVKGFGASIIDCDPSIEARLAEVKKLEENNYIFIPPYDNLDVITGQATIMLEILSQLKEKIDYVVCPLGGGGLISGICTTAHYMSPETKIIGAEPT